MITLTSCISVDYDLPFLPHFIKHYNNLDYYKFIFHSKYKFYLSKFEHMLEPIKGKYEIHPWIGEFSCGEKMDKLNQLQTEGLILTADIDEYQIWDRPLEGIVWGKLRDRESLDSTLSIVTDKSLNEQFPVVSEKSKWGRSLFKPCLFPYDIKFTSPHHLENIEPSDDFIDIDHFRWVSGRLEKSIERIETYKRLNREHISLDEFGAYPTKDLQYVIDEYGTKPAI